MSSLLDHLDNNCSDRDEDDHINRLFPKCKPRASSLQPFATSATDEECSIESKGSLSDCNLTNSNSAREQSSNINTVNNNLSHQARQADTHPRVVSNVFSQSHKIEPSSAKDYDNFSFRCLNGPVKVSCENSNNRQPLHSSTPASKPKGKSGDNRHSRNRRRHQHHTNTDSVSREKNPLHVNSSRGKATTVSNQGKRQSSSSSGSQRRIMESDTLEDHFDNGIESGGSGGSGSNGSAFSHCSSLGSSGEKNNGVSVSSSGLGSSGGNIGLRDSRIEIAGGREIFSHSRIKVGRRVRGSSSMDSMILQQQQGLESSAGASRPSLTPSSSQSQLQAKVRRKSTNNTMAAAPPVTHSSPISSSNCIWEPHHVPSNKKSFPFSSSSSSSSRGERERDRERTTAPNFPHDSSKNSVTTRHGQNQDQSGVHCSYLRSSRSSHAQSQYYGRHGGGYPDGKKTMSLDGFEAGSHGTKSMLPQVHSPTSVGTSPSSSLMMKETVFASEITSIEKPVEGPKETKQPFIYQTPIDGGGEIVFDDIEEHWRDGSSSGRGGGKSDDKEPPFVSMGSVDKSQLNFLDTLMRDNDEEQQQLQSHSGEPHEVASVVGASPSNPSGYESDECASSSIPPNNSKTSPNNGNKRLIGNIPIAEYEGSPKRYGLRLPTQAKPSHLELVDPNSPTTAHSHLNVSTRGTSPRLQSPSSSSTFQGARVPGFPLRVDTTASHAPSSATLKSLVNEECSTPASVSSFKDGCEYKPESDGQVRSKLDALMSPTAGALSGVVAQSSAVTGTVSSAATTTATADTSPDDSVVSQQGSNNTTTNSSEDPEIELSSHRTDLTEDREDYLLYEFSETRKVLDEFFKPAATAGDERLGNFDELDYTLRRQTGNSYVGQRLAGESCNEQVEESPKKPPRRGVLLNVSGGGGASPRLISFQEVSLPLSHSSHLQSSISPSSSIITPNAALLLDSARDVNDNDIDVETASTNTETDLGDTEVGLQVGQSRNFTLSPETTDCDSNELESEISLDYEASLHSSSRIGATMPVLEDGLSSGNVSDNEDPDDEDSHELKRNALASRKSTNLKNIPSVLSAHVVTASEPNPTLLLMKKQISEIEKEIKLRSSQKVQNSDTNGSSVGANGTGSPSSNLPDSSPGTVNAQSSCHNSTGKHFIGINNVDDNFPHRDARPESSIFDCNDPELEALDPMRPTPPPSPAPSSVPHHLPHSLLHLASSQQSLHSQILPGRVVSFTSCSNEGMNICSNNTNPTTLATSTSNSLSGNPSGSSNGSVTTSSAPPPVNTSLGGGKDASNGVLSSESSPGGPSSTADTHNVKDAVTLPKSLSSQRAAFETSSSAAASGVTTTVTTTNAILASCSSQLPPQQSSSSQERLLPLVRDSSPVWVPRHPVSTGGNHHPHRSVNAGVRDPLLRKQRYEETPDDDADTDQETDRLLGQNRTEDDYGFYDDKEKDGLKKKRSKEDLMNNPSVLIEGVLFRARYLGSTQLVCEGQPTKATRMMQAEEAVSRIKAPEGETQPSTEVDLFISTEKIMVLNTDLKEIMMDHALRTISYIADIGDLVVLMARRRPVPTDAVDDSKIPRPPKMICHVFESDEAQYIAQSIGQAFQVAYMEFLKANGIEDHSFVREMDYQEVLNSQEIFGDELQMFAKKELQKEVVVPKTKGEILGVVIVESGWGSMLPTVVIANLAPAGAAARCGQLNIGDQIIAINGVSLVGLPLSTCQNYIKNAKTQTVVKLTVVPCPPVVEVKIKRPDTKYQLGFSVQNGVICSLLRGGIAERGGVRVGHRIIEINNQSVVAVPHEKIVNLLATSVGEINMKTMPTSMFRLLTGQETPLYI